ncbi:MAG TPA: HAMP domain-containing sensor histidine kinase [Tepidisphaeraceae bacterium]|nr:HAMP domain-containing sensor histidine kinase [Tepidisphaeraceae bacterium]
MRRTWPIWLTFLCFLALGLGAMGWMTRQVLTLDAAQTRATAAAALEENVRLALWRMDSMLAPIVSQENARPYFEYSAVFPAERAYTRMYTELKSGDVLVPSPLLRSTAANWNQRINATNRAASPLVLLHFQVAPDGTVSSPQAPTGQVRKIAESRFTTPADIAAATQRLEQVRKIITAHDDRLAVLLPTPPDPEAWANNKLRVNTNGVTLSNLGNGNLTANSTNHGGTIAINPPAQQGAQQAAVPNQPAASQQGNRAGYNSDLQQDANPQYQQQALVQSKQTYDVEQQRQIDLRRGQTEYAARAQTIDNNNDLYVGLNTANYFSAPGVSAGVMRAFWADSATLLLARKVTVNGQTYTQGCLLDWAAIKPWLLTASADLIPRGELAPDFAADLSGSAAGGLIATATAQPNVTEKQPRMLATIPARLVVDPGAMIPPVPTFLASLADRSPLHVTLTIAWAGVILASAAVAVLLRGVVALSQRRAGFVSAVTHELRTPLTTLRMYTEMLADGMVSDPDKQAAYHKTLRAEANRLGHLVDNVLLYSRLERSCRDAKVEAAPLADLLDRLVPRLADRAAQADMTLAPTVAPDLAGVRIRANLLSVEQILFNLVDNACKYAAGAPDGRIELSVTRDGKYVAVRVRDHGPGLDVVAKSRLFEPFSKSVHEAANSAPGLGLGLALSRRLAANMGADLRLDPAVRDGAGFVLRIPVGDE